MPVDLLAEPETAGRDLLGEPSTAMEVPAGRDLLSPAPAVPAPDTFRPGAGPAGEPANPAAPVAGAGPVGAGLAQAAGATPVTSDAEIAPLTDSNVIDVTPEQAASFQSNVRPQFVGQKSPDVAEQEAVTQEIVNAVPRMVYKGGAIIRDAIFDTSPDYVAKQYDPRVPPSREPTYSLDDNAAEMLPAPPLTPAVGVAENIGADIIATAPLMYGVGGAGVGAASAGAANTARALGAGARVAGAVGGAAGTAAGITEFGVMRGGLEALKTGDAKPIGEGITSVPKSMIRLATGKGEAEDYVTAALLLLGAGVGAYKAVPGGVPAAPNKAVPKPGGTRLAPEHQQFVDNIPADKLAAFEASMARKAATGNDGARAFRDAARAKMNGGTTPKSPVTPVETPVQPPQTAPDGTTPAIVPRGTPTLGGVPGSSKPFQAVAPQQPPQAAPVAPSVPPQPVKAAPPVQTPPIAPAPQTGGKPPIQETADAPAAVRGSPSGAQPRAEAPAALGPIRQPGPVAPETLPPATTPPPSSVGSPAGTAPGEAAPVARLPVEQPGAKEMIGSGFYQPPADPPVPDTATDPFPSLAKPRVRVPFDATTKPAAVEQPAPAPKAKAEPPSAKPEAAPEPDEGFSVANRFTKEVRERHGFGGLPSPARKSFETSASNATKKGLNQKEKADVIVEKVLTEEHRMSDEETAGLAIRGMELETRGHELTDKISKATEPAEIRTLTAQLAENTADLNLLTLATHRGGTPLGRDLAARRMLIGPDYSVRALQAKALGNGHGKVKDTLRDEINKVGKELEKQKKATDEVMARLKEVEARNLLKSIPRTGKSTTLQTPDLKKKLRDLLDKGCGKS